MTPEEQQQVNAGIAYLERQVANVAREGVNVAMAAESLAIQLKAAQARIKELEPKPDAAPLKVVE